MSVCTSWRHFGSGGTIPSILKLRTNWRWMVRFTIRPIYPLEKSQPYPLNIWRMGIRTAHGTLQERKKSFAPAGNRTKIPQAFRKFRSRYGKHRGGLQTALCRNWCTGIPLHKSSSFDPQDKILDIKILNALSLLSDGPLPSVKVWANDPFRV